MKTVSDLQIQTLSKEIENPSSFSSFATKTPKNFFSVRHHTIDASKNRPLKTD